VIDLASFKKAQLRGGFIIEEVTIADEPLIDAIGREAIARTTIIAREFFITIRRGLTDEELSVTLYHEILEAMTVASNNPPASVTMFNEAEFERAAYRAHNEFGPASPETLDRMLQSYDFGEQ